MRRLSFRSLLFLLALVMQTATGGMAFAGTLAGVPGLSAGCAQADAGVHQAGSAHSGHHKRHACELCQLCAGANASAAAIVTSDYRLAFRDDGARLGLDLSLNAPPAAPSERGQQPRAPPIF